MLFLPSLVVPLLVAGTLAKSQLKNRDIQAINSAESFGIDGSTENVDTADNADNVDNSDITDGSANTDDIGAGGVSLAV
jgi:hypothetical protein